MINLFNIIAFFVLCGFILTNSAICDYFRKELRRNKCKYEYMDIVSAIFGILMSALLLLFLLYLKEVYLMLLALGVSFFVGMISYVDYQIFVQNSGHKVWWHKQTHFDKIIICLMAIISIGVCYYNTSLRSASVLAICILFFVYVFVLKKIKNQHKISDLFSNKYAHILEIGIRSAFYYFCWLIIAIYIVSMGVSMISSYFDPYDADGCMDTGICKEGFTFDDCGNGIPCIIIFGLRIFAVVIPDTQWTE